MSELLGSLIMSGRKALNNYDVLFKILEEVTSSRVESQSRRSEPRLAQCDLAACARVCRSFTEPAVRLLWGQIDSLLPLWHLLAPDNVALPKECTEEYINLLAEAKLYDEPGPWDRFLWYSKFVRRLFYDSSMCGDGQAHLFKTLLEHNGGQPLLSALRTIEWKRVSSRDYSFTDAFFPGLVDVTLSFARQRSSAQLWRDIDLKPLLVRLRDASPALETFQLRIPTQAESWIVEELVQFPRLRRLYGSFTLDFPSLTTLVSKLALVSLHITLSNDSNIAPVGAPGSASLPLLQMENLRELRIQSQSQSVTQLFTALHAPQLRSLTVCVIDDPNSTVDYPALMDAIANAVSSEVMQSLVLEIYMQHYIPRAPRPAPIPLVTLLHPILPMQNLETFELKFGGRLQLSGANETFADIARRWSALRTFSLCIRDWHPDGPSPTPAILMLFARSCPNLRELVLPYLDHRALVLPSEGMPAPHPLLYLDIFDRLTERESTNEESTRMAEYIHRLFPSIDLALRHYGRSYDLAWTKVFHRIRMVRETLQA
ncbi:hypothetical protein L227DRAFT_607679 [Lentinus tigrinus ALCF2SS1-6]|uniref:F-box domain-containing protein n=1 Tax=Lentinus tigrinus ALCF2SS1-6 TaxID=1328759 RepID=A0A5C2SP50_9APHY|nr:hypothetical protein L227DRAFT_607679 [Lentinus tigrinus ALCF2SS1-6]